MCVVQFLLMLMGAFAVLAWFGSLIDNLLLTYLIGQCTSFLFRRDQFGCWPGIGRTDTSSLHSGLNGEERTGPLSDSHGWSI